MARGNGHAVDVRESDDHVLVHRNVDAGDTCHFAAPEAAGKTRKIPIPKFPAAIQCPGERPGSALALFVPGIPDDVDHADGRRSCSPCRSSSRTVECDPDLCFRARHRCQARLLTLCRRRKCAGRALERRCRVPRRPCRNPSGCLLQQARVLVGHHVRLQLRDEVHATTTTISSEVPPNWNGTPPCEIMNSGTRQTPAMTYSAPHSVRRGSARGRCTRRSAGRGGCRDEGARLLQVLGGVAALNTSAV